jgi:aspartyl/asparaginyl beta-hydroxylase (cupin superfamily)/thioredoxin-like negative regulator of GroEL
MDAELATRAPGRDQRIKALVAAARQTSDSGEAERLIRQAEREDPRHPLVLNESAARMMRSGDLAGATALLQQLSKAEPKSAEIWFNLAMALKRQDRVDEAVAALERVLTIDSGNVVAHLEKAGLEELQLKPRAAAMSYRTALQVIPPGLRPPPQLEAQLARARRAVEDNNRALENYVDEELSRIKARFPGEPTRRFDQCVDIMLQKRSIWRQQPTFMYFPEMPAIEFYDRDLFPWLDRIEAAAGDIRAELVEAMSEGAAALDPYVAYPNGMPMEQWRELNNSRRWGVYSLWREGKAYPEHIARCPRTVAALADRPQWDVPGSGPTALFSILDAKTRIPAHTGPVNTRLVVHLPLIVPPGCGFRVGGQQREWVPGKAFVFDDSINHEAWNDSDVPRAVLIFDIWSPYLSQVERELTRALTVRMGEWYGTTSNSNVL